MVFFDCSNFAKSAKVFIFIWINLKYNSYIAFTKHPLVIDGDKFPKASPKLMIKFDLRSNETSSLLPVIKTLKLNFFSPINN